MRAKLKEPGGQLQNNRNAEQRRAFDEWPALSRRGRETQNTQNTPSLPENYPADLMVVG